MWYRYPQIESGLPVISFSSFYPRDASHLSIPCSSGARLPPIAVPIKPSCFAGTTLYMVPPAAHAHGGPHQTEIGQKVPPRGAVRGCSNCRGYGQARMPGGAVLGGEGQGGRPALAPGRDPH